VPAGSSRNVTSLAKPSGKGFTTAGGKLRRGSLRLHRGRAIRGHFPFPNPSLAAAAPGLGHLTHEALLQGRFAHRFNDRSSSCAQNRGYFLFFLSFLLNTWLGQRSAGLFSCVSHPGASAACSLQPGAVCPSTLGKLRVLVRRVFASQFKP